MELKVEAINSELQHVLSTAKDRLSRFNTHFNEEEYQKEVKEIKQKYREVFNLHKKILDEEIEAQGKWRLRLAGKDPSSIVRAFCEEFASAPLPDGEVAVLFRSFLNCEIFKSAKVKTGKSCSGLDLDPALREVYEEARKNLLAHLDHSDALEPGWLEILILSKLFRTGIRIHHWAFSTFSHERWEFGMNYERKIDLVAFPGHDYSLIISEERHRALAIAQAIVYEILYDDVFKMGENAKKGVRMLRKKTREENVDRSMSVTSGSEWEEDDDDKMETTDSAPPIPWRVAKRLDPSIYRNVDYDVFERKEMIRQKVKSSNQIVPGSRCTMVNKDNYVYVQRIIKNEEMDAGFAEAFDLQAGEIITVPLDQLRLRKDDPRNSKPGTPMRVGILTPATAGSGWFSAGYSLASTKTTGFTRRGVALNIPGKQTPFFPSKRANKSKRPAPSEERMNDAKFEETIPPAFLRKMQNECRFSTPEIVVTSPKSSEASPELERPGVFYGPTPVPAPAYLVYDNYLASMFMDSPMNMRGDMSAAMYNPGNNPPHAFCGSPPESYLLNQSHPNLLVYPSGPNCLIPTANGYILCPLQSPPGPYPPYHAREELGAVRNNPLSVDPAIIAVQNAPNGFCIMPAPMPGSQLVFQPKTVPV